MFPSIYTPNFLAKSQHKSHRTIPHVQTSQHTKYPNIYKKKTKYNLIHIHPIKFDPPTDIIHLFQWLYWYLHLFHDHHFISFSISSSSSTSHFFLCFLLYLFFSHFSFSFNHENMCSFHEEKREKTKKIKREKKKKKEIFFLFYFSSFSLNCSRDYAWTGQINSLRVCSRSPVINQRMRVKL